jgi:hypothetical protein
MQCKNQECKREFLGNKKQNKFCSSTCRTRFWTIQTKERRKSELEILLKNHVAEALKTTQAKAG